MSTFVSDKVYCDTYYCPKDYKLVDNADDVYCKDKKCTKDQCCKKGCRLYTSPSPRDLSTSRMPSSA